MGKEYSHTIILLNIVTLDPFYKAIFHSATIVLPCILPLWSQCVVEKSILKNTRSSFLPEMVCPPLKSSKDVFIEYSTENDQHINLFTDHPLQNALQMTYFKC